MEGPYRTPPKGDREFDPEKHVKIDEKSWVRKSAAESDKKAKKEAERRNIGIEEPNWFAKLFGKINKDKENYRSILQEQALENELKDVQYYGPGHSINEPREEAIEAIYDGQKILLFRHAPTNGYLGSINAIQITDDDAKKMWERLFLLLQQRDQNKRKLEQTNTKLALEGKNEPKQLGPKTEE